MNVSEYANPIEYFEQLYKQHGMDEKSLGWSKHKQPLRFEQVCRSFGNAQSILDVGCGFGDLYSYLQVHYADFEYYGIDILDKFIVIAQQMHNTGNAKFACSDMKDLPWDRQWDWVVECGLFGLKQYDENGMYEYISQCMRSALGLSKKGIAFNFLSDKVDYKTSNQDFHASPEKVLNIAYGYSRRVILDNSVLPFEYCVTVWKDDGFSKDTTVFDAIGE